MLTAGNSFALPSFFFCPDGLGVYDTYTHNRQATNDFFFGGLTRISRTAIGFLTASAVAERISGVKVMEFFRTLPRGGYPILGGVAGTATATIATSVINGLAVAAALEVGINIGAATDAIVCAVAGGE